MKKNQDYIAIVNQASEIAKSNFNNSESIDRIIKEKESLVKQLENEAYIKVPVVGDFNAGKSSLLNSFMGVELLPTDILPQTAVSYELYYAEKEELEVWHNGAFKMRAGLSQISSLTVVPGDIVKVYINNEAIKELNERGIVLVDMPGIDSGIQAHNDAILNYIQNGTHFVIVMDVEQGTIRNTVVSFIDELKKYGLSSSLLISKADKKPKDELAAVKETIEDQAKRFIGENVKVGVTSASEKNYQALVDALDELDAETLTAQKYSAIVAGFVKEVIDGIKVQISVLSSSDVDYEEKIRQLEEQRDRALASLQEKNEQAQPLSSSADDILRDVENALVEKSSYLATMLLSGENNKDVINNEILSIIRPILINSFKREISEYQETVGEVLRDFSVNVEDILNDKDNQFLGKMQDLAKSFVGADVLEALMKKGLEKLIVKFAAYRGITALLKTFSKILGPIIIIVVNLLPDILKIIFGKSNEKKMEEIRIKIVQEVCPKIVEALRPQVEEMLQEQRNETLKAMEDIISQEVQKYDANIRKAMEEKQADESMRAEKVKALEEALNVLSTLLSNI